MDATATRIQGLWIFTPTPHPDERGFFTRTFENSVARGVGIDPDAFVQDSQSRSRRGVIRGMHLRSGTGEAKLVRCSYGSMFDAVVDLRTGSPTFGVLETFLLDDVAHRSIYIPPGCAHGWQALGEPTDVCYRIDQEHDPSADVTIAYDDPELAVPWPEPATLVSAKDRAGRSLADVLAEFGSGAARP